jgi:hypothetical protein
VAIGQKEITMRIAIFCLFALFLSCGSSRTGIGSIGFLDELELVKLIPNEYIEPGITESQMLYNETQKYQKKIDSLNALLDSLRNKGITDTIAVCDTFKAVWKQYSEFSDREYSKDALFDRLIRPNLKKMEIWKGIFSEVLNEYKIRVIIEKNTGAILYPKNISKLNTEELKMTKIDLTKILVQKYKDKKK